MASADPRTGRVADAGGAGSDGDTVEEPVGPGVADAAVGAGVGEIEGLAQAARRDRDSSEDPMILSIRRASTAR